MPKNLCIIPARGGSKRIPRKNIKDFLGKPIIAYSVEAALKSGIFDEVMVSTDDKDIADIAIRYGAKTPFYRSSIASSDFATTVEVLIEVLDSYKLEGKEFDNICCLYPTAPFANSSKLKFGYQKFHNEDFDSLIPILAYSFPIQRSFKVSGGKIQYQFPEFQKERSQDLETIYHDTGQFYYIKTSCLKENQNILTSNTGYIEVSELEAQDIDNESDWKLAELKYELL